MSVFEQVTIFNPPNSQYNENNYEVAIRTVYSFLNRSISIIVECFDYGNPPNLLTPKWDHFSIEGVIPYLQKFSELCAKIIILKK